MQPSALRVGLRALLTTFRAVVLFLGLPLAYAADPDSGSIQVLLSADGTIHRELLASLRESLAALAGPDAPELSVTTLPEESSESPPTIKSNGAKLLVAVGTRATELALTRQQSIPVLAVMIPRSAYLELEGTTERIGGEPKSSAIVIDQPVLRQLALTRAVLPRALRLGVLLGPRSAPLEADLRQAAGDLGLELSIVPVSTKEVPARAFRKLTTGSDAVLAVYDPVILNPSTAKWMLYAAYQSRLPLIGFSQSYLDAGATAAVFSTPADLGRQAAEEVLRHLADPDSDPSTPIAPRYYRVGFNAPVARSLGVRLPDADEVVARIADLEGKSPR